MKNFIVQDRSIHSFHAGSPSNGPGILPSLPFEPARPMQPQQSPTADRAGSRQAGFAPPAEESSPEPGTGLAGQQAPRGSFARLLLSGGLWGLQPERGQTSHTSPTESSSKQQSNVESSRTRHKKAAGCSPEPAAAKPLSLGKSESDPGQIRDSLSHTAQPLQQGGLPARVSLLAQGLAKDSKQPQQAQPAPFNPFQSWSHLLPPVTTVKRTGPPSSGQPARR